MLFKVHSARLRKGEPNVVVLNQKMKLFLVAGDIHIRGTRCLSVMFFLLSTLLL